MDSAYKIRVLIVDDEEDLCESLGFVLQDQGYETFFAHNTSQAYTTVVNSDIDIVLSDVRMPGENGVDLMKKVRKTSPQKPLFLLMTGFADISEKEAVQAGAELMLRKPVKLDILLRLIKQLADRVIDQHVS
ncbi:MAG: response regulator [Oligoflexus sp.]|jgi:DNA-binding NtrC family response regulator